MVVSGRLRVAVVVAAALTMAGCERGKSQSAGTPVAQTPVNEAKADVAARLAPVVFLAQEDRYRPMDADAFVASSQLWWAHERVGCQDERIAPSVDVDDLVEGRYEHTADIATPGGPDAECVHQGRAYRSNEPTRPYNGDGPPGANGFYLDVDDGRRPGDGPNAPVYWQYFERGTERAYVYWLFYAYNDAPGGGVFDHEGEWERVAVRTDEHDQPVAMTLWRHEGSCGLPWNNAEKVDGRAVAYSAIGTHASYAAPDTFSIPFENSVIKDRTDRGPRWDLGAHLKRVEDQKWWGYGGGWGAVGEHGEFATHRSGPAGPTPGRNADAAWPEELCRDQDKLTATIDKAFVGDWKSIQPVNQPGSPETYYARLTIRDGGGVGVGDTVGSSFYPELGCSGPLTLIEAGPDVLKVRETISTDPKLTCVKEVMITLRPSPTGLDYETAGSTSTAKLAREAG
jgi:hypothetical protein